MRRFVPEPAVIAHLFSGWRVVFYARGGESAIVRPAGAVMRRWA